MPPAAATTTPSTSVAPPALAPPATAPAPNEPPATAPPATAPPATAPASPVQSSSGPARVQFSPAQVETTVSNTVTVALTVESGADIFSAPFQLRFDPKILRLNDVSRGGLLSVDGQQPVFTKSIMNDSGTASIQLNRSPGTPGVTASGVLVTMSFQAVSPGTATVSIPNLSLRDSQGQVVASASPQLTVTVK